MEKSCTKFYSRGIDFIFVVMLWADIFVSLFVCSVLFYLVLIIVLLLLEKNYC